MFEYFTSIFMITNFTLVILTYLVHENARLENVQKKSFYRTYAVVMLASVAEWVGLILNGAPSYLKTLHILVKVVGYLLHPAIAYCFFIQIEEEGWIKSHFRMVFSLAVGFMAASFPYGWVVYVDKNNYYHHGPLYFVYSIIYLLMLGLLIIGFLRYGRKHRHHNDISLMLIAILVVAGSIIQQKNSYYGRTFFLTLAIASVLLFVHYEEFYQQQMDEDDEKKTILLEKDALTGLYSRYAFNKLLKQGVVDRLENENYIIVIDINGLKKVNDTRGHEMGDALICAAAIAIDEAVRTHGKVYRTGGDEFVAVLDTSSYQIDEFIEEMKKGFRKYEKSLKLSMSYHLSASVGWVCVKEHPNLSFEQLLDIADKDMYENKKRYYEENHIKRY